MSDQALITRYLRQLESLDPMERQNAILFLSASQDDPHIASRLQQIAHYDPVPDVRALAQQKLLTPSTQPLADRFFLFYPQNRRFLDGTQPKLAGVSRGCFFGTMIGCMIALLLVLILVGLPAWQKGSDLKHKGITTTATVYAHEINDNSDGTSYYVSYEYWVNDNRYWTQEQVNQEHYDQWGVGSGVTVRYLPTDPQQSDLVDDSTEERTQNILLILGIVTWMGLMLIAIYAWNRWMWMRRLISNGTLLRGTVQHFHLSKDSEGGVTAELHYRFTTPTGRVITKRETRGGTPQSEKQAPPLPGTPVYVLFADEWTYRVL